jgi:hypothetical protein
MAWLRLGQEPQAIPVLSIRLLIDAGPSPYPILPIIPGHETVGRIDAMGAGVKDVQIGERAAAQKWILDPTGGHVDAARHEGALGSLSREIVVLKDFGLTVICAVGAIQTRLEESRLDTSRFMTFGPSVSIGRCDPPNAL